MCAVPSPDLPAQAARHAYWLQAILRGFLLLQSTVLSTLSQAEGWALYCLLSCITAHVDLRLGMTIVHERVSSNDTGLCHMVQRQPGVCCLLYFPIKTSS